MVWDATLRCHSATELGSGIEMRVPCRTNQVEAFTRKNEYGSLLLAALGLVELNMVKKRCLLVQTRY
jgi:hypothetical protein